MAYGPTLKNTSNRTSKLKWLLITVVVLVVLGAGGFLGYRWYLDSKAQDPIAAESPQSNVEEVSVGAQDNQTPTPSPIQTPPGQTPAAESSTDIVITSPTNNQTIKAGTKLEGTAPNVRTVNYRMQSDDRGLVGQGELAVINNKFSGTLVSTGVAGTGFLEVFVIDTQGREQKHAKVEVNFQ